MATFRHVDSEVRIMIVGECPQFPDTGLRSQPGGDAKNNEIIFTINPNDIWERLPNLLLDSFEVRKFEGAVHEQTTSLSHSKGTHKNYWDIWERIVNHLFISIPTTRHNKSLYRLESRRSKLQHHIPIIILIPLRTLQHQPNLIFDLLDNNVFPSCPSVVRIER
jgi:hypothetical protein